MTLRELLKSLHAVDEKHLDMDAMVSPASGGYAGIDHVSVLYVGHAVIHLAEPKPSEPPPNLWAGSGEGTVATVNPDDLKKVWQVSAEFQAKNPGHGAIGSTLYESVCSPGADVTAVWYRASMLGMLQMFPKSPLAQWTHDGELDVAVF